MASTHAFRQRLYEQRKRGQFHSAKVAYTKSNRTISRYLPKATKLVWDLAQDDLKAPMGCAARPAMFSPAALNFHFGDNIKGVSGMERTAYGLGSGALTCGLNPDTMKIHPMPPELVVLRNEATKILSSKSEKWKKVLTENPLNFCNVKHYYSYRHRNGKLVKKRIGWHGDCSYNRNTKKPLSNNSQVPGSLTVLLTFGAPKNLWFRRQRTKKDYDPNSLLHFQQKSGSLFCLDGRDEKVSNDGYSWVHCSDMAEQDGITFTFAFHCVQRSLEVTQDGGLVEQKISEIRRAKFQEASGIFETLEYKSDREELESRMKAFIDSNCMP
jgi:hypothetical protein